MSKSHIFLTGGTGHLGTAISKLLLAQGYDLTLLVLQQEMKYMQTHRQKEPTDAQFIEGNLLQIEQGRLESIMGKATAVIHAAGDICTETIDKGRIERMRKLNEEGAYMVINAAVSKGLPIVYIGSIETLVDPLHWRPSFCSNEVFEAEQLTEYPYAHSKAIATYYALEHGAKVVIPTSVIGPSGLRTSKMVDIIRTAATKRGIYVDGNFNFVDERDVARAILFALDIGKEGDYYLAYGHDSSLCAVQQIASSLGGARKPIRIPTQLAYALAYASDTITQISDSEIWRRLNIYAMRMLTQYKGISNELKEKSKEIGYHPLISLSDSINDIVAESKRT